MGLVLFRIKSVGSLEGGQGNIGLEGGVDVPR